MPLFWFYGPNFNVPVQTHSSDLGHFQTAILIEKHRRVWNRQVNIVAHLSSSGVGGEQNQS